MVRNSAQATIGVVRKADMYFKKLGIFRVKKIAGAALVFLAVLLGWVAMLEYFTADKYQVVAKIGNETTTEAVVADIIDYGTLAKGESVVRFITVENRGERNMYVKTLAVGEISDILKINKSDFTLFPQEKETIQLLLEVPQSADKAQYKGRIIVFKIPAIF